MEALEPLRVLLVTDMGLFRDGLADLLRAHEAIAAVQTASSVAEAAARATQFQPHVTVVDVALLGPDVVAALRERASGTRVLAFGVADEWEAVLACARAGAAGFVTRDGRIGELLDAVRRVHRGELICSPRMAARMFEEMRALTAESGAHADGTALTVRELEIAELLERGLSNKEIARRLFIEQTTVKNHVHHILAKLQVARRGEAAARLRWHSRPTQPH